MASGHHIFLSYKSDDLEDMLKVYRALRLAGLRVWIDKTGIPPGTPSWTRAIQEAIRETGGLACLLTPQATDSRWVMEELYYAQRRHKWIVLVMVRAAGDDPEGDDLIPFGFSTAQVVDIRRGPGLVNKELIPAIQRQLGVDDLEPADAGAVDREIASIREIAAEKRTPDDEPADTGGSGDSPDKATDGDTLETRRAAQAEQLAHMEARFAAWETVAQSSESHAQLEAARAAQGQFDRDTDEMTAAWKAAYGQLQERMTTSTTVVRALNEMGGTALMAGRDRLLDDLDRWQTEQHNAALDISGLVAESGRRLKALDRESGRLDMIRANWPRTFDAARVALAERDASQEIGWLESELAALWSGFPQWESLVAGTAAHIQNWMASAQKKRELIDHQLAGLRTRLDEWEIQVRAALNTRKS